MQNTILQVVKVEPSLIEGIKDSFNNLPETDHADGKYRLRKYSKVRATPYGQHPESFHIEDLNISNFTQSEKYNKHQGGKKRTFINVDEDVIKSSAMQELVGSYWEANSFPLNIEFDIHQMRVKCKGGATQLSPEGWHQDGYDCVAMIGVHRENIIGGEILLSTSKTDNPFLSAVIDCGTMVIIDDSYLWHNGRSIQPIEDNKPAYMDVIVFTGKNKERFNL